MNKLVRSNIFGYGEVMKLAKNDWRMVWTPSKLMQKFSSYQNLHFDCIERASVRLDEIIRLARWKKENQDTAFTLAN